VKSEREKLGSDSEELGDEPCFRNNIPLCYPSDVSDEEWSFVAPYLALCREDAPQRSHSLRSVFNALRWLVKTGAHWRMMPNDLPPWPVVYQQTRRWIRAGCFEIMVEDLRSLLREFAVRKRCPRRWW
jgi:transposase